MELTVDNVTTESYHLSIENDVLFDLAPASIGTSQS
jgi:hypothetical protein